MRTASITRKKLVTGMRGFLASQRYFTMKIRRIIRWVVPAFVFFWFPCMFYLSIINYHTHFDDPFTIMFGVPCALYCAISCFLAIRRREKGLAVVCGLAAASCVFFCYWIYRIPFCTMCDPIRKSDLGFMLEPFADRFGDLWIE